jgi:hypothetical protein
MSDAAIDQGGVVWPFGFLGWAKEERLEEKDELPDGVRSLVEGRNGGSVVRIHGNLDLKESVQEAVPHIGSGRLCVKVKAMKIVVPKRRGLKWEGVQPLAGGSPLRRILSRKELGEDGAGGAHPFAYRVGGGKVAV